MQNKPVRKRLNQREIDRKIDQDFKREFSFIIPREGTVEFKPPEESHLNRGLANNRPFVKVDKDGRFSKDGEHGHPSYYYIPQPNFDTVQQLFKEFFIPEDIQHDITWSYLNMVFASCEATYSTNFQEQLERKKKELCEAMDLLEAFSTDKVWLSGVSFEFKEKIKEGNKDSPPEFGLVKSRKFKGHIAVQFVEKVLQNYKASRGFEIAQLTYDMSKKYGKTDMYMGYKNAEKHSQSYYCSVLFQYLNRELFRQLFDLLENPDEFDKEEAKLKKSYSRRKRFLFIGKLMMHSGLLVMKANSLDDDIIEVIEKKLTPQMRTNKRKQKENEEHNQNPTDNMLRVQMFDELF